MESLKCSVCLEKYKARKLKPKHPVTVRASSSRKSQPKPEEDTPTGLLSEEVSVIYLVQTILDIPSKECVKYLEKYGNPSDWVTLCPSCSTRLRKARDLSDRVVELQRKLEVIKQTIRDQMRVKDELPEGANLEEDDKSWFTVAYEIRQYVSYAPSEDLTEEEELEMNSVESGGPIDPLSVNIDSAFEGGSMFVDESGDRVYKEEEAELDFEDRSPRPGSEIGIGFEDQTSWEAVTIYPDREEINESDGVNGPNSKQHIHPPTSIPLLESEIAEKNVKHGEGVYSEVVEKATKSMLEAVSKTDVLTERAFDSKDRPLFVLRNARPRTYGKNQTGNSNSDSGSSAAIPWKKIFSCDQCTVVCPNRSQLEKHVTKMHTPTVHKCITCGKGVPFNSSMAEHVMSAHHPPSVTVCSGCNVQIPCRFNIHLKSSPECKEKAILCPICKQKYFPTQAAVDIHVEFQHLVCSVCNKRYRDKHMLKRHVAEHHSGKRPYKCDKCGKGFAIAYRLKHHFKVVHLNKEPDGQKFPCKTCGRVFTNREHLRRHEKLHGDDAPFLCTVCGKRYKVGGQLTTHMWSHDPDRYEKYSLYKYKNQPKKGRKKKLSTTNFKDSSRVSSFKSSGQDELSNNVPNLQDQEVHTEPVIPSGDRLKDVS